MLRWTNRHRALWAVFLPLLAEKARQPGASPACLRRYGKALLDADDAAAALPWLEAASDGGADLEASLLLAWAELRLRRLDDAELRFGRLLDKGYNVALCVKGLAEILRLRGDIAGSLRLIRHHLEHDFGNPTLQKAFIDWVNIARDADSLRRTLPHLKPAGFSAMLEDAAILLDAVDGKAAALRDGRLAPDLIEITFLRDRDDPALAAIAAELLNIPHYSERPYKKATRNGVRADFGVTPDMPATKALFMDIKARIDLYLLRLSETGIGFAKAGGDTVRLDSWVTRLRNQGYEADHIHPSGWISGVFYVQIPDEINNTNTAGHLQLPIIKPWTGLDWPPRSLCPIPGLLVLFPSYIRHRTIPFTSAQERISIAFDVVPNDRLDAYSPLMTGH